MTRADGLPGYLESEIDIIDPGTGWTVFQMTSTSSSSTSLKSPMIYAEGYEVAACGRGTSSATVKCTAAY